MKKQPNRAGCWREMWSHSQCDDVSGPALAKPIPRMHMLSQEEQAEEKRKKNCPLEISVLSVTHSESAAMKNKSCPIG